MLDLLSSLKRQGALFCKDEEGTTLVEFAICVSLFLLILFAVIDFGRLGYHWVASEKAMQRAVRVAAVRFPACDGTPEFHRRNDPTDEFYNGFKPGTVCREVLGLCVQASTSCTLAQAEQSTDERRRDTVENLDGSDGIWPAIQALLPPDVGKENVLIRYEYDERLGFLGGPYVPLISAELVGDGYVAPDENTGVEEIKPRLFFKFETPLSQLAGVVGTANANDLLPDEDDCTACIPFPNISATLPGEDLNQGMGG